MIIFDFDGTLYDSFDMLWDTINKAKKKLPILKKIKTRKQLRELYNGNFYDEFCEFMKLKTCDKTAWMLKLRVITGKHYSPTLFDEMKDTIKNLAKQDELVIVSSDFDPVMTRLLKQDKIEKLFTKVLGAEQGLDKAEKVRKLLKEKNLSVKDVVYVTDTVGDVKEMLDIGVKSIGVSWGFQTKKELLKAGAVTVLDEVDEMFIIPEIMQKLRN